MPFFFFPHHFIFWFIISNCCHTYISSSRKATSPDFAPRCHLFLSILSEIITCSHRCSQIWLFNSFEAPNKLSLRFSGFTCNEHNYAVIASPWSPDSHHLQVHWLIDSSFQWQLCSVSKVLQLRYDFLPFTKTHYKMWETEHMPSEINISFLTLHTTLYLGMTRWEFILCTESMTAKHLK